MEPMITYKTRVIKKGRGFEEIVSVFLAGKMVGLIRKEPRGWRYWPKGDGTGGDLFPSQRAVKKSLEAE